MPEPNVTPETPKPDAAAAIAEQIAAGLRTGLSEVVKELRTEAPQRGVEQPRAPVIEDVTDEEIDNAVLNGKPVSALLRKRERANQMRMQTEMNTLRQQGSEAIGSAARQLATQLPYYGRFKKEIDEMVNAYGAQTGAVITFEAYENAHNIVKSRHVDEIVNENVEERIRKSREPENDLGDVVNRGGSRGTNAPKEPESLQEWFDSERIDTKEWKFNIARKARQGQASLDDNGELRKIGFNDFKEFNDRRKRLADIEVETNESFYLDRDWDSAKKEWIPEGGKRGS